MATSAPTNASTGTGLNPRTLKLNDSRKPSAPPSAAPPETPSAYGSASGLRSRPWKSTPALASAAPTMAAPATRGRRIAKKMASSCGRHVGSKRAPTTWFRGMRSKSSGRSCTAPNAAANKSAAASTAIRTAMTRAATGRTPGRVIVTRWSLAHGEKVGVQQRRQCFEAVDQPGPWCGEQRARDGIDGPVLDRREHGPAGAGGDHLGRLGIEGQFRVGQDDDLGIARDDDLRADLTNIAGQVAEDVGAAGHLDQLPVEAIRPGHERLVGLRGVELLVDPWPGRIAHRGHHCVAAREHVAGNGLGSVGGAKKVTERADRTNRRVKIPG